jgi:nicotinate-nucleotide adenylyltransferase
MAQGQGDTAAPVRLGIFGGTFDPIHLAHLIVAQEVAAQLALDRVIFIPTGSPPHKQGQPITPGRQRLAMVEHAIAGNPRFAVSAMEIARSGPSFTVDTLAELRAECGAAACLVLILGGDMVYDIVRWRDPAGIVGLVTHIAAVQRPGFAFTATDLAQLEAQVPGLGAAIVSVDVPQIAISASMIRARLARDLPITYLVPEAVVAYIQSEGLYRPPEPL